MGPIAPHLLSILDPLVYKLRSTSYPGQGKARDRGTDLLLSLQYSSLLLALSFHLLVGVNVSNACQANPSKRQAK